MNQFAALIGLIAGVYAIAFVLSLMGIAIRKWTGDRDASRVQHPGSVFYFWGDSDCNGGDED